MVCLSVRVCIYCFISNHLPVAVAADGLGDGGGEGRMWRVKWLLGLVAPFKLTRRLKTGFSIPDGPFQSRAKQHEGMTALALLLISSTECLEIYRMNKKIDHSLFPLITKHVVLKVTIRSNTQQRWRHAFTVVWLENMSSACDVTKWRAISRRDLSGK